jgi:hypothetical protein
MKKTLTLLAIFASLAIFAQAPQGFNYQATVRNAMGSLIVNQNVYFKFNIMLNSQTSVPVFTETHYVPTDDLGQVNLIVGNGTATTGNFSSINWASGSYYLGIELNTGNGYVAMGTTQLLSVPYALYANTAGTSQTTIPNLAEVLAVNNGANNLQIKNLADPTDAQDAVTKAYLAANATNLVSGTANGDLLYWNGSQWAVLSAPQNNAALKWCEGQLVWGNCPGNFTNNTEAQNFFNNTVLPSIEGPLNDNFDIPGTDAWYTNYVRGLFHLNEVPTDLAILGWGDSGIPDLVTATWLPTNEFNKAFYLRLNKIIEKNNEFIKKSEDIKYDPIVRQLIAEARFMRALAYYNYLDLYGKAPIITETSSTTSLAQNTRQELFNFVESELVQLQEIFEYPWNTAAGKMSKAVPQALLTRLYINAEVYIGVPKYSQCIQYCNSIFNYANNIMLSSSDLNSNGSKYDELFLADNGETSAKNEFIYSIKHSGLQADNTPLVNYGGTTFLCHAAVGGTMNSNDYGINIGWSGLRTRKNLVQKFTASVTASNNNQEPIAWNDKRANFHTNGQSYEITNTGSFTEGYAVKKWINKKINNQNGSNTTFVDIDYPVIRLAEIYLNYAEAHLRGGGGDINTATNLINSIRTRSNGSSISTNDLNLSFVLDERARELYWECLRRTDLIRYNLFTGNQYLWPFKGGVATGTFINGFRKLYPIPQDILTANPNFIQNPGY